MLVIVIKILNNIEKSIAILAKWKKYTCSQLYHCRHHDSCYIVQEIIEKKILGNSDTVKYREVNNSNCNMRTMEM